MLKDGRKDYNALFNNGTWKLVDRPFGTKPIGCKWVHKIKYKSDGSLDKTKVKVRVCSQFHYATHSVSDEEYVNAYYTQLSKSGTINLLYTISQPLKLTES